MSEEDIKELENMEKQPVFSSVQCQSCIYEWNGFFPDGIKFDTPIECPKCNKKLGMLLLKDGGNHE